MTKTSRTAQAAAIAALLLAWCVAASAQDVKYNFLQGTDFSKYKFDLTVRATDFRAMNSTKAQNRLYYGQLIFSSNMRLKGTAEKPVIDGNITIGDKTNVTVVLPQTDPSVVKR